MKRTLIVLGGLVLTAAVVLAQGTSQSGIFKDLFLGTAGICQKTGTGSPEGAVTCPEGSIYVQTDGTAGRTFWLKDGGTGNDNSGWWAPGQLRYASVTLTHAQIGALATTPITVVAAPGTGRGIFVQAVHSSTDFAAGAYSDSTVRVRYASGTTDLVTAWSGFLNQTARRGHQQLAVSPITYLATEFENQAVQVSASANPTGGNAANTWTITVLYLNVPVE